MIEQRELILIPYPFSDSDGQKVRPAVVISNNEFNRHGNDILAIPLTSVIKQEPFSIMLTQKDLEHGKLIKESRIRIDKIFSVSKDRVIMKIGKINNKIFNKIKEEILKLF